MSLCSFVRYHLMLWNWKRRARKRRRSHFSIANLADFFASLNKQGVSYAVLRWFDEVPMTKDAETALVEAHGDLDLLAEARHLHTICRVAAEHYGKVKVDLYSNRLVLGTDVQRFTYYPPVLCQELLEHCVIGSQGFKRPDDLHYLYSLAYHLTYQKGLVTGIPSGFDDLPSEPKEGFKHDAEGTLRDLSEKTSTPLPEKLTLLNLHLWLKEKGWNMPFDLLLRWPHRHPLLDRLYRYEADNLRKALGDKHDLCVFLLREDAIQANATQAILDELTTEYRILDVVELNAEQQDRVTRRTRGGNWTKHKAYRLFLPQTAVVCQALVAREPLDDMAVVGKEQEALNPNLRFKRALRQKLEQQFPEGSNFLHASDNDIESMEYIQAVYGDEWPVKFLTLFQTP